MEEEKTAADKHESSAIANKSEGSSEEAVDEIAGDSSEATETEKRSTRSKLRIAAKPPRPRDKFSQLVKEATVKSKLMEEATASGAAEEDKPLKYGSASNKHRPGERPAGHGDPWEYRLRKYLLLLATLVATVTYTAGFKPPVGLLDGDPIILDTSYTRYVAFFYSNATAFVSSLVVIALVQILDEQGGTTNPVALHTLRVVVVLDLLSLMGAYAAGTCRDLLSAAYFLVIVAYTVAFAAVHMPLASWLGEKKDNTDLDRVRKVLMLLATFAVCVTYQACLSAPGGFWDHGEDPGHSVVTCSQDDRRLKAFVVCNTTAMAASLLSIMLLLHKDLRKISKLQSYVLYGFMLVTLAGLMGAYSAASYRMVDTTVYVYELIRAVFIAILFQVVNRLGGMYKSVAKWVRQRRPFCVGEQTETSYSNGRYVQRRRQAGIRSGLFVLFTNPRNVIKHIRIPLLIVVIAGEVFMLTPFITEFVGFVWLLSFLTSFSILWILGHMILPWWFSLFSSPYGSLPYWCAVPAIAYDMQSPAIGMFLVQLIPHFAAGFLGYVLAQHHNHMISQGRPMSDNEDLGVLKISARLIHALLNLGVTLRLAWVLSHSDDYTPVDFMMHFLLPLIGGLLLWITFIVVALGDAFMGDNGLALVVFYFFFIMLNYILMVVTLGHTVATLATWFAVLGLSGFLGYSIHIYNSSRVTRDLGLQASSVQSSRPDSSY